MDRHLNVLGSGLQHVAFFRGMLETLKELFEEPLERQPRYVADMGCGDGSLLLQIYDLVRSSRRGKHLEERRSRLVRV